MAVIFNCVNELSAVGVHLELDDMDNTFITIYSLISVDNDIILVKKSTI